MVLPCRRPCRKLLSPHVCAVAATSGVCCVFKWQECKGSHGGRHAHASSRRRCQSMCRIMKAPVGRCATTSATTSARRRAVPALTPHCAGLAPKVIAASPRCTHYRESENQNQNQNQN